MSTVTYTTNDHDVTFVRWNVSSERVAAYDESADDYIDDADSTARMQFVLDYIADAVRETYPNVITVSIVDGGFENQFASMSERCESISGAIYEGFYDDMTIIEDHAISAAFRKYPAPTPEPDAWETYGDPNNN